MRIVHLLKHCNEGNGHVHVAVDLACTHARSGERVAFVSSGGTYEALLEENGVELIRIPRTESTFSAIKATWKLLRDLRGFQPDVIHAHMMSSAIIGYIAGKILNAPLVTTVHNSFDRHSGIMRLGRRIVAVSEFDRKLLASRRYPSGRLVTVLNGATESPRQPAGHYSPGTIPTPAIVSLCGLHRRKAVGDSIRAFSRVAQDAPGWNLIIIGDGPDRKDLQELARSLGVSSSVQFYGSVLRPQGLLLQAQIFVSASLSEPFGLAIAEARAAGCAIVATRVGGVPEVLDQGRAGILVSPSRPDELADSFGRLIRDARVLEEWQQRALDGSDKFMVKRMADDYLKVYRAAAE